MIKNSKSFAIQISNKEIIIFQDNVIMLENLGTLWKDYLAFDSNLTLFEMYVNFKTWPEGISQSNYKVKKRDRLKMLFIISIFISHYNRAS